MFLKLEESYIYKNGFKTVPESDHVVLSKNWVFVGKDYTNDGMFKLNLEINEINDVSVYFVDSSTLWHARLAHLDFSSFQYAQAWVLVY